ncbi:MAG TPA: phosphatase PAP2 family protein [Solirubrobacterales bacterium]|nr:phosphatase PAP2 family protein [Solirubrobacterales bacterium]
MAAAGRTAQRLRGFASALLPRGPLDLLIQLVLLAGAYWAWRHARGAVDGGMGLSFSHARDLVSAERSLGLLIEPSVQHWAVDAGWPSEVAGWGYANLHFKGSCLMLAILYFGYRGSYGFVRNAVFAAMAISVIGYALFPTAPPRFLPELGLDPSSSVTGNNPLLSNPGDPLFNPFAAVPSMHVGLSVILAWSLGMLVRPRLLRAVFFAYPLLMAYVVIASGNHFWLDAVFGLLTAALAVGAAMLLARLNSDWSFGSSARSAPSGDLEPQPEPEAAPA